MSTIDVRAGVNSVIQALREPEAFAVNWDRGTSRYPLWIWACLAIAAIAGTLTYGLSMGIHGGPARMLTAAVSCTAAAGLAWFIPLPALYIINSISGSKLTLSSTILAALVTTSWGGLAMLASLPINWFFSVAIPYAPFVFVVNLVVFAGVGTSMIDVFGRVMQTLEPQRGRLPAWWLLLVGVIGAELFYFFGLFQF